MGNVRTVSASSFKRTRTDVAGPAGVTSVDLYESHDNGANWSTIGIGLPNTGSLAWVGTAPASTRAGPSPSTGTGTSRPGPSFT